MKTVDAFAAKKKIAELKKKNPKNCVTNYFLNPISDKVLCFQNENALVILNPDRHIHRLIFEYSDLESFEKLLFELPQDLKISLEIVTKKELDLELKNVLNKHFVYDTTFVRSRCKLENIRKFDIGHSDEIKFAQKDDIPAVGILLSETFSYHSSHYPDEKELEYLVQNKQVIVIKKDKVVGLVIFKKFNRVINLDQGISRDKNVENFLMMQEFLYETLRKYSAEECFLWVDIEGNKKVQKMHELYGYKPDGLKNIIFVNKLLKSNIVNK